MEKIEQLTQMNITPENDGVEGQPQIEPSLYCIFNIKQINDGTLSVAIKSNNTSKNVKSYSVLFQCARGKKSQITLLFFLLTQY